jgi:hypothetical protein
MAKQRGLHDEAHDGEIDPGVQEIWAGSTRVGYIWVNRYPDSFESRPNTKFVLLSDKYPTPGNENFTPPRNPDVTLQFKWIDTQMPLQIAISNLKKTGSNITCTFTEIKGLVLKQY